MIYGLSLLARIFSYLKWFSRKKLNRQIEMKPIKAVRPIITFIVFPGTELLILSISHELLSNLILEKVLGWVFVILVKIARDGDIVECLQSVKGLNNNRHPELVI